MLRLRQCAARWELQCDLCLVVVARWRKTFGQQGCKRDGCGKHNKRCQQRDEAVVQAPLHDAHVAAHEFAVAREVWRGGGVFFGRHDFALVRCHEVGCHHGGDEPRHQQRKQDGDDRCPGKLLEEQAHYAAHKRHREEDRYQRKGGSQHCQPDFVGCFHGCFIRAFTHAQVALDVFDFNNGIVYQHAHYQR